MARDWIMLHVNKWIDGSTRYELTHAQRAIFADLLALAGRYHKDGKREGLIPVEIRTLVNQLNAPQELIEDTLKRCQETGKITINDEGIHIIKWAEYQPSRQLVHYHDKPLHPLTKLDKPLPKKGKAGEEIKDNIKAVFEALKERDIDPIYRAKEASAIKRMLVKGYTPEQIIQAFDHMRTQDFWQDKAVSMVNVAKDIQAILAMLKPKRKRHPDDG